MQTPVQIPQLQFPPQQILVPPDARKQRLRTALIIATVIIIVAAIVVAAFFYLMLTCCIIDGDGGSSRPYVTFSPPAKGGDASNFTVTIIVESVSDPITDFTGFKGQIIMDVTPLVPSARQLKADTLISFGSSVTLIVDDSAGEGKLTPGDSLLIYGMTGSYSWKFSLLWGADSSEITSAHWTTP